MSHSRPHAVRMAIAWLAGVAGGGLDTFERLFVGNDTPSFSQRYGNNPRSHNGGQKSGAAAIKRAARRRRNIRARSAKRGAK